MISFTGQLDVADSPAAAFEKLGDMSELDRWNPNVASSRRTSGDRFSVGSTYESVIVRGPMRMTAMSTLTEVDPGRKVRYEGDISIFWSADELAFEPLSSGCRITFSNQTIVPRWLLPLTPILNAAFQPQARKAVAGAQRYLSVGR